MESPDKSLRAQEIVKNHVLISMGAGLVPIPILDIAAVTAVQLDMVKNLAQLYGADYSGDFARNLLTTLTGSTLARIGASMIKALPGIGTLLGGVSMSIMSGASTYAVGQTFIRHFSTGASLFDFDTEKGKASYERYYEEGKDVAAQWDKEKKAREQAGQEAQDPLKKLERLAELRDKGALTEEEFQLMKRKLLEEM
ncbi:MAG: DUF697 domain-containing protein [Lewinellaceae bacterium]|nr:DUF697 domain-containing protein [Lewinellaceae bacterium]